MKKIVKNMNWNIIKKDNVDALLIVAHPDDETIFCGGTMLSFPNWNWKVICVTMQMNTVRPYEFGKAMSQYKHCGVNIVSYLTLDQRDEGQNLSSREVAEWETSIQKLNLLPDIVFTHNEMGEYGHNHHMELSRIVQQTFSNVWKFVYPGDDAIFSQLRKSKVNTVSLREDILNKKRKIFDNCYKSQVEVWRDHPGLMKYEFESGFETFIFTK